MRWCPSCGRPKEQHSQGADVVFQIGKRGAGEILTIDRPKGSPNSRDCKLRRLNTVGEGRPQRYTAIRGRR